MTSKAAIPVGLEQIRECFTRGRPVLFLGAGPSMSQGGPSWTKLGEMIADKFHVKETDMLRSCDMLCRPNEGRVGVEAFIDEVLSPLAPGTVLSSLLALDWRAVFTTNYDPIPEKIGATVGPRRIVISEDGAPVKSADRRTLPIYKVMGSCYRRFPDVGAMQLSASDIRRGADKRRPFLQELHELLTRRDLVIVGSSLEDNLLLDFFEDMLNEPGARLTSKHFLVSPRPLTGDLRERAEGLGVVHITGDVNSLVQALTASPLPTPPVHAGRQIHVGSRHILLSPEFEDEHLHAYVGRLIDSTYRGEEFAGKETFYRRSAYSKEAFDKGWDFQREFAIVDSVRKKDLGTRLMIDTAIRRLHDASVAHGVTTAALIGPPGSAKTMTVNRILHDWAAIGGLGLYQDVEHWFDAEGTGRYLEGLAEAIKSPSPDFPKPAVLVVLDNASFRLTHALQLAARLRRQGGATFAIVVTGRKGDFARSNWGRFNEIWELEPHVSAAEHDRFRAFLREKFPELREAHVDATMKLWGTHVTFFALLYNLIRETQEPLEQSVLKNFNTLPNWEQELFRMVATFQAHNLPLPEKLASRVFPDKSYLEITDAVDEGHLQGVVERTTVEPFDLLRCLDSNIASTIFTEKVKREGRSVSDVVCAVLPRLREDRDEKRFMQNALVTAASRERGVSHISPREAEKILSTALRVIQTRTIAHHYGLVLLSQGRFEEAEGALTRALKEFTGEKPENIHNSLGELYLRWGKSIAVLDPDKARILAGHARDEYTRARTDSSTAGHHGLAKLLLLEAELEPDRTKAQRKLVEALQICDFAPILSDDPDDRERFGKTRAAALQSLSSLSLGIDEARKLFRDHHTAAGFYYLVAEIIAGRRLTDLSQGELADALRLIREGLTCDSHDRSLSWLCARAAYLLDPTEKDALVSQVTSLKGAVPEWQRHLLLAKIHGSNGQGKEAMREMDAARRSAGLGLAGYEWDPENALRTPTGLLVLKVERKDDQSFITLPGGLLVAAEEFKEGDAVNVAVSVAGPILRSAS